MDFGASFGSNDPVKRTDNPNLSLVCQRGGVTDRNPLRQRIGSDSYQNYSQLDRTPGQGKIVVRIVEPVTENRLLGLETHCGSSSQCHDSAAASYCGFLKVASMCQLSTLALFSPTGITSSTAFFSRFCRPL